MDQETFSGVWSCRYWYPSNDHNGEDISEYDVMAHQVGHRLTMTSLPTKDGSYITLRLSIEGNLATGAWQECTAPDGSFGGMIYSGAMQLIIDDSKKRMDGKWVGIGREKIGENEYEPRIYTGKWELVFKETQA
ncbi:MAG: hypothetical protein ACREGJ_02805 [Candidatus Saccharimonadales bacterium]